MGDDDVICLSSDDDVTPDELPPKKPKTGPPLLTAKIEQPEQRKGIVLFSQKRKFSENSDEAKSKTAKRTKSDNKDVEEISVKPVIGAVVKTSKSNATIKEHVGELRLKDQRKLIGNRPLIVNSITVKKFSDLSESGNKSKSSHSKAPAEPAACNDVQKLPLAVDGSKQSNGKIADFSKSQCLPSAAETKASIVVNPVAKLKSRQRSESPGSANSKTASAISEVDHGSDGKKANGTPSQSKSHMEKPKAVSSSKIADDKSAKGTKRRAVTPTSFATTSKIVDTVEKEKVGSVAIATKSRTDRENTLTNKPVDSRPIRDSSTSPEILIISSEESSTTLGKDADVKSHFSNSNSGTPKSKREITQTYDNSNSCTPKSSKKFQFPCATSSQALNDCAKDVSDKAKDILNGDVSPKAGPSILPTEDSDLSKSLPKSESRDLKTPEKDDRPIAKRISPKRLSESPKTPGRSKHSIEKSSKSSNSASPNTTKSDSKVKNSVEKKLSNDSKKSSSESKSKSKDCEPKPGCSKSPDVSSSRRKSSSETKENVKSRLGDSSQSMDFEPQPGCSKSPDDVDQKPRLVVVEKRPVSLQPEDTFSMFISLCLQTDRCPEMETVVSKLKRYYEELNPAYAASDTFRDTLNEKREKITQQRSRVYHYIGLLKDDMKANKKSAKTSRAKKGERGAEAEETAANEDDSEEDPEEARRKRFKIKKIEKAMKECQRKIKKYEEEELDFDDDNNSAYIKLERYKDRIVELYTQMCKYTNEHPDAGRAYLRPKHYRVTQIPSVDQAINSFVNSKLSGTKKKGSKSVVDGLIFPDYVDILECVEKANKEQELKLDKRAMQNMAEKAFTQLGRQLQTARQNDYWETFVLNLEDGTDPSTSDRSLSEKLAQNKIIAEENEKNVFEEYVRKQEERKTKGYNDSAEEEEDDDDDDEEEEEEEEEEEDEEEAEEDNEKKSDRGTDSEVAISDDEESDRESEGKDKASEKGEKTSERGDKDDAANVLDVIPEVEEVKDDECPVEVVPMDTSRSNNLEAIEPTADERVESSENSAGKTVTAIEVTLDDTRTKDDEIEPEREERFQQPLRIRSFAKPPDSWQCSQEIIEEAIEKSETKPPEASSDNTEDDVTVVSYFPRREIIAKKSKNNGNITVTVASNSITKNATSSPTTNSRLSIIKTVTVATSTALNTISGQSPKYLTVAPKTVKVTAHTPEISITSNRTTVRCFAPIGSSTPIQQSQSRFVNSVQPIRPRQQVHQVQVRRVGNAGYVTPIVTSQFSNAPRIVTVSATSTPLRLPQMQPQTRLSTVQSVITPVNIVPAGTLVKTGFSASSMIVGPKNPQQNRVLTPVTLTAAQFSNLQHGNNGKYVNRPASSSENLQTSNIGQQQRKVTNNATTVVVPLKVANVAGQTVPSVLKLRMNDNVQTIQLQRGNVVRVTRSGLT